MSKIDISNNCDILPIADISNILNNKNFSTQYQPFVCLKTEEIVAYEALARFEYKEKKYPPNMILNICHYDLKLFFEMELALKRVQFKNRPKDKKLFVNFDPHVFGYKGGVNELFSFFKEQDNFAIELVENSHISINIKMLIDIFNKFEFEFAMDDFFKEDSIISIFLLNKANYIKLDKDILKALKTNNSFIHIIEGLVNFAHTQNKKVVLEGVETKEDLELVKTTNVDYVQGYLYGSLFIDR